MMKQALEIDSYHRHCKVCVCVCESVEIWKALRDDVQNT